MRYTDFTWGRCRGIESNEYSRRPSAPTCPRMLPIHTVWALLHEVQAEDEVIDQQDPIADSQPVQATLCQRKLLVGRQAADAHSREADLQLEKQRGAGGECHSQQGIHLLPPILQVQQG